MPTATWYIVQEHFAVSWPMYASIDSVYELRLTAASVVLVASHFRQNSQSNAKSNYFCSPHFDRPDVFGARCDYLSTDSQWSHLATRNGSAENEAMINSKGWLPRIGYSQNESYLYWGATMNDQIVNVPTGPNSDYLSELLDYFSSCFWKGSWRSALVSWNSSR